MNKVIKYRREFHKYPEVGWREYRTSARIAEILENMGYNVLMGPDVVNIESIGNPEKLTEDEIKVEIDRAESEGALKKYLEKSKGYPGVIAILDTERPGPITAFRFDMDCLPYQEPKKSGFRPYDEEYISVHPDHVHACGHDGHISIGLGIAEELLKIKDKLCGKIKLIFQPAEETFYGAQSIVDKGHLDDVKYFIALHLALSYKNSPLPSNTMVCGCKDFLSDRQLDVYFNGKSAHPAGAAQEGKNALLGACSAALNLHAIAPHEEGLSRINVGELHAGVCANTIAPNAMLRLEYRGETVNISKYLGQRVEQCIEGAATSYDLKTEIVDYGEVPAAKSDDELMEIIYDAAQKVDWFKDVHFEGNVGGTDDASVMILKVQENGGFGTYVGIGTDTTNTLHNAEFDFDEDCLMASVNLCIHALENIHKK